MQISKFGISKDRVELHLEYKPNGFNIDTLKYSLDYSLVLLGPMPHSMEGKGEYTSIITRMEREAGFPPVKRLMAGDENPRVRKGNFTCQYAPICAKIKP